MTNINRNRELIGIDQNGNEWKISIEVIKGYTNRFKYFFKFNGQEFYLGKFNSAREASNFWALIENLKKNNQDYQTEIR